MHDLLLEIIYHSNQERINIDFKIFNWKKIGRLIGFLFASLDIFETYSLYLYYAIGDNQTFSFGFSALLYLIVIFLIIPSIATVPYNYRYNPENCSFSAFNLFFMSPIKIKIFLIAYFFGYGSFFLISIYTTSWVTMSILSQNSRGVQFLIHRRDFEIGVSWGATDMFVLSMFSLIFSMVLKYLINNSKISEAKIWAFSNFISAIALTLCFYLKDDFALFLLIPLCSLIFTSIQIIPQHISTQLDKCHTKVCPIYSYAHSSQSCKSNSTNQTLHIPFEIISV